MKNDRGITMIALIVTIIVLIILAGISISSISGDNGIIKNSQEAKIEAEIADEKKGVENATVTVMNNDKFGTITQKSLQNAINSYYNSETVATVNADLEVIFAKSGRKYKVSNDGKISELK